MGNEKILNINWDFCFKITATVVLIYLLFMIKDLIIWFIFALVISILFNFLIDFLEDKKIPRILAVVALYFGLLSILGFFFYKIAPFFLSEIKQFSSNLPLYFEKVSPIFQKFGFEFIQDSQSIFSFLENNLEKAGQSIISALITVFGGIKTTFFIILLSFFLSLERNFLEKVLASFAPHRYKSRLINLLPRVKKQVSGWFISRIIGVIFVGILCYLVLKILDVKYAFIFSLLFGVFDFIPIIGPIIAGIIIVSTVMIDSLNKALFVLLCLILIQQLENSVLIPVLSEKFTGIPPVLVLIALAIGATLWGVLGGILAIPLSGVIFEIVKDYLNLKQRRQELEIL